MCVCNAVFLLYSPKKEFIVENVALAHGRKNIDYIAVWIQVCRVLFIYSFRARNQPLVVTRGDSGSSLTCHNWTSLSGSWLVQLLHFSCWLWTCKHLALAKWLPLGLSLNLERWRYGVLSHSLAQSLNSALPVIGGSNPSADPDSGFSVNPWSRLTKMISLGLVSVLYVLAIVQWSLTPPDLYFAK